MKPKLIDFFSGKSVLLDSNLLLLLGVGITDRQRIGHFKRTSQFRPQDFDLLTSALSLASGLLTTPHVLAEVSNLAGALTGPVRKRFFAHLAKLILERLDEQHVAAVSLIDDVVFERLGVTDTGLAKLCESGAVVLSADLPLCLELQRRGLAALNFNHLRTDMLRRKQWT